jgi:hypothetical protein
LGRTVRVAEGAAVGTELAEGPAAERSVTERHLEAAALEGWQRHAFSSESEAADHSEDARVNALHLTVLQHHRHPVAFG